MISRCCWAFALASAISVVYASFNRNTSVSKFRMYCSFRSRCVLGQSVLVCGMEKSGVCTSEPGGSALVAWSMQACYPAWVHGVWAFGHLERLSGVRLCEADGDQSPRVVFLG